MELPAYDYISSSSETGICIHTLDFGGIFFRTLLLGFKMYESESSKVILITCSWLRPRISFTFLSHSLEAILGKLCSPKGVGITSLSKINCWKKPQAGPNYSAIINADNLKQHAQIIWTVGRDGIEVMSERVDVNMFILSLLQMNFIFHCHVFLSPWTISHIRFSYRYFAVHDFVSGIVLLKNIK